MATRTISPNEYLRMEKEVERLTKENAELKARLNPPTPNPVVTEVMEPGEISRRVRTPKPKDDESTDGQ